MGDCSASDKEGLTEFEETNMTPIQTCNPLMKFYNTIGDSFPPDNLEILQRNYLVATYSWTPSSPATNYSFPAAIMAQNDMANTLFGTKYRFMRTAIKYQIQIATTQFHQGTLMVTWMPTDLYNIARNKYYASGNRPVILDASAQDSMSGFIPWMLPQVWIDCTDDAETWPVIGTIRIEPLNTITAASAGISTTISVKLYASFVGLRVAGFMSTSTEFTANRNWKDLAVVDKARYEAKRKKKGKSEMADPAKTGDPEAQEKQEKGATDLISGGVHTVSHLLRSAPVIGKAYSAIADIVRGVGKIATEFDRPSSFAPTGFMRQRQWRNLSVVNNIDGSETCSLYSNPKVSIGFAGCEDSFMSPIQVARVPMLHDQFSFSAQGTAYALAVHPASWYTSANENQPDYLAIACSGFRFWRGSIKYLFQFVGTPFYSVRVKIIISPNPSTEPNLQNGDHPGRVLDIKGSTLVEVLVPYLDQVPWRYVDYTYDNLAVQTLYIYAMTAVQGSSAPATATFQVNVWRAAGEDFQLFWPVDSYRLDGDHGVIFFDDATAEEKKLMSAGAHCISRLSRNRKKPVKYGTSEMDVQQHFKHTFCSVVDKCSFIVEKNFISSEHGYIINDLIKRPQLMNPDSEFWSYPDIGEGTPTTSYSRSPIGIWSRCFLAWRGGRRVINTASLLLGGGMCINAPPVQRSVATNAANMQVGDGSFTGTGLGGTGWAISEPEVNPQSSVWLTVPWVCTAPYCYTDTFLQYTPPSTTVRGSFGTNNLILTQLPFDAWNQGGDTEGYSFMYAGEDFHMFWLTSPVVAIIPSSTETNMQRKTTIKS